MTAYLVGDPDPTADVGPWCHELDPATELLCTWTPEHRGDHVSGNGKKVAAVWPNQPKLLNELADAAREYVAATDALQGEPVVAQISRASRARQKLDELLARVAA